MIIRILFATALAVSAIACRADAPASAGTASSVTAPGVQAGSKSTAAASNAIEERCAAKLGPADPYRTAKQLGDRLVGRWARCDGRTLPLVGLEYTADGKWYHLTYEDGVGWARVPGTSEHDTGDYKVFADKRPPEVPRDDDARMADDFFVMENMGRPMALHAFEKSPRRMVVIGYANPSRWIPIEPR